MNKKYVASKKPPVMMRSKRRFANRPSNITRTKKAVMRRSSKSSTKPTKYSKTSKNVSATTNSAMLVSGARLVAVQAVAIRLKASRALAATVKAMSLTLVMVVSEISSAHFSGVAASNNDSRHAAGMSGRTSI